jgi:hypothetical protein
MRIRKKIIQGSFTVKQVVFKLLHCPKTALV